MFLSVNPPLYVPPVLPFFSFVCRLFFLPSSQFLSGIYGVHPFLVGSPIFHITYLLYLKGKNIDKSIQPQVVVFFSFFFSALWVYLCGEKKCDHSFESCILVLQFKFEYYKSVNYACLRIFKKRLALSACKMG